MSANQIKRTIGVSYKTAWYLCHRIRAAMKETQHENLGGVLEIDETYIGGRKHGTGKAGCGAEIEAGIHGRKHKAIRHKDHVYLKSDTYANPWNLPSRS